MKYKRVIRYNFENNAHELTFSCYHNRPYLEDYNLCQIFLNNLRTIKEELNYSVFAFILMPTHSHVLVYPNNTNYNISTLLKLMKGRASKQYSDFLQQSNEKFYQNMLVNNHFKLWQRGGGYDRNITNIETIRLSINYIEANPVRKGLCLAPTDWKYSSACFRVSDPDLVDDLHLF